MMRKFLILLILLCLIGTASAEDLGRTYKHFEAAYAENIVFINENTGRHLLPHTPTRDYAANGNRIYRIQSGTLSVEIHLDDLAEQIARCQITLTAPENLKYGSSQHHDFNTAGYHSYALIMAMDASATPYERYALVNRINEGLAASGAEPFVTQAGDYRLTCTSAGGVATMLFENELFMETEPITPAEDDVIEEEASEEDEFLG